MTKKQLKVVDPGIYRVVWRSGGSSLAAVGKHTDGTSWLAPVNWLAPSRGPKAWRLVRFLQTVMVAPRLVESEPPPLRKEPHFQWQVGMMEGRRLLVCRETGRVVAAIHPVGEKVKEWLASYEETPIGSFISYRQAKEMVASQHRAKWTRRIMEV